MGGLENLSAQLQGVCTPLTPSTTKYPENKVSGKIAGGTIGSLANGNGRAGVDDRTPDPSWLYEDQHTISEKHVRQSNDGGDYRSEVSNYRGLNANSSRTRGTLSTKLVQGFKAGPGGNLSQTTNRVSYYPETNVEESQNRRSNILVDQLDDFKPTNRPAIRKVSVFDDIEKAYREGA